MGACRLQKRNQTPSLVSGNPSLLSVPDLPVNLPSLEVFVCRREVRAVPSVASVLVTGSCWIILPTSRLCRIYCLLCPGTVPILGSSPAPTHTPAPLSSGSEVRLAGPAQPPTGFAVRVSAASCWKCHKGQDASRTSFMCPQMLVYSTHEKYSVDTRSVK